MKTATKTIWKIDPAHTEIHFKVKHMMVSTVTGAFTSFDGQVESNGEDFEDAIIKFEADIDSISTNNKQRDAHLKSADFFDAEQFPKLTFESISFTPKNKEDFTLKGNLTIHGVTKEVELSTEFNGVVTDPYGNVKAGFELSGIIRRKYFGLTWNALTEAGSIVVSDKVRLVISVQLIKS
ncbi:MAG: YceI family protein [Saprospiraceae bacterium]|nr:YceI family protein [Saprospiraceae bacterium]